MKKTMIVAIVLMTAGLAQAVVTVVYDPGTLYTTDALTGYSTYGDDMVGMVVTAYYATGGSQDAVWGATGVGAGGAFGSGWSLTQSGDTFSYNWSLTNNTNSALSRVVINAAPGDTIFDTDYNPYPGTVGSADGREFSLVSAPADLDIFATYRNQVALTGDAPVGDLWALLQLDFTSAGGLGAGYGLTFKADTDMAATAGDVNPVIPAPGAVLLGSIGVSIVGWLRRRKTL